MYRLSQDVIVKQRGGIYFGLNMKTGTTYEMNESQFDIVSFFKNDYHSKDELLTYLTSIYDVTSKEIEAEVDFTLNESVSVGLLIEKIFATMSSGELKKVANIKEFIFVATILIIFQPDSYCLTCTIREYEL